MRHYLYARADDLGHRLTHFDLRPEIFAELFADSLVLGYPCPDRELREADDCY
jgi:hypothetical protein